MKKLIATILVLVLALSLVACGGTKTPESTGGDTPAADDVKNVYFISLMTGGAAWSLAEKGFNDACAELGWNGYYLAPVERNNMTEMVSLLENAITAKADAIIGVYASLESFGPALLTAKEKGIVTASVQVTLAPEYIDFQIGTDQTGFGKVYADAVAELAGDKVINAVFMHGSMGETTNMIYDSIAAEFEKYDNLNLVEYLVDDGSAVTAAEVIANYRKANPEINAVICGNSSAATIGVASFVEEQGLEEDWLVVGVDASADILNYVKSKALDCTVAQDFYSMGYKSVMMCKDILTGGPQPAFINDSGCFLIRPDEVDAYAEKYGIKLS